MRKDLTFEVRLEHRLTRLEYLVGFLLLLELGQAAGIFIASFLIP